jgi:mono/diheme cytochrome c family protein
MGMGKGMMARHHAQIPAEYAGLSSPTAKTESIKRGGEIYSLNCASCHGDGGMGDGPAGTALDPAPAAIAHTSQMMSDAYLFWRISEGSAGFDTSMPAWKGILDDQARWDVINYVRALGRGEVMPASSSGGAAFDPQLQAEHQAEMLAQAVEQGVITPAEAEMFILVHDAVESYRLAHPELRNSGDATEQENMILAELVKAGIITQTQADAFSIIHDQLGEAGLMP